MAILELKANLAPPLHSCDLQTLPSVLRQARNTYSHTYIFRLRLHTVSLLCFRKPHVQINLQLGIWPIFCIAVHELRPWLHETADLRNFAPFHQESHRPDLARRGTDNHEELRPQDDDPHDPQTTGRDVERMRAGTTMVRQSSSPSSLYFALYGFPTI